MSEQKNKGQFDRLKDQYSKNKPQGDGPEKPKKRFNLYWIYAAIFIFFILLQMFSGMYSNVQDTNWHTVKNDFLINQEIEKIVVVNKEEAYVYIKRQYLDDSKHKAVKEQPFGSGVNPGPHYKFNVGDVQVFDENMKVAQIDVAEEDKVIIDYETKENVWGDVLSWVFPIVIMIALWIFIMRRMSGGGGPGGQIFSIGKSKAQLFDPTTKIRVTFKDVAGLEEAKVEIQEIVNFLKDPEKYTRLGGRIPRGVLLVGPPGTGKTLLAKAVAGEAKVPFFSLSGSDFVEMFVGVGASRVRDLFKQAKEKSPAIIFIDEIDAVGRARGRNSVTGANDERENTLNQLLTEMDGFDSKTNVIVMAATNRADVLDRALLRAGRFDRQVYVDLPDLNERKEIFDVHLKDKVVADTVDPEFLAKQTPGFSGADIANVCNEAALIAARNDKESIDKQDFLDAVDRIIGGLEKKNKIISKEEKETVAFHEAGHATTSWLLEHAAPLVKVTIVPRGRSLGAAWYLPEERQLTTREQMMDEMTATMGGRAAEKVIFGKISTGALSDLEKVTRQAQAMVTIYGLNDRIGNITYYDSSGQNDYTFQKPYSEKTAEIIDQEISKIIEEAYDRAIKLLEDNRDKLTQLANRLLEEEVVFKEDLEEIFGKRLWLEKEMPAPKKENVVDKSEDKSSDEVVKSEDENSDIAEKEKEDSPDSAANI